MATRNGAPGKELRVKRQQLAIPDLGDVGDVFFWREKIFETSKRMPGDSPFLGIKHQILEINWLTFFDGDLTMNKCQLGDLSINLVGGWAYPSEKYARQLGWLFSIYGKMKNVPNHQPVNNVGD